jgi:hypothetical protein
LSPTTARIRPIAGPRSPPRGFWTSSRSTRNRSSPQAVEARLAKEDLRPKLLRYLTDHYSVVQSNERTIVRGVHDDLNVDGHLPTILGNIGALAKGTPFAEHFKNPDFLETVRRIVGQFTANVMHIERRYHADRKQKVA